MNLSDLYPLKDEKFLNIFGMSGRVLVIVGHLIPVLALIVFRESFEGMPWILMFVLGLIGSFFAAFAVGLIMMAFHVISLTIRGKYNPEKISFSLLILTSLVLVSSLIIWIFFKPSLNSKLDNVILYGAYISLGLFTLISYTEWKRIKTSNKSLGENSEPLCDSESSS